MLGNLYSRDAVEGALPTLLGSHPKHKEALAKLDKLGKTNKSERKRPIPASLDDLSIDGSSSLAVRNTFIHGIAPTSPSLEGFYQERQVNTCPSQRVGKIAELFQHSISSPIDVTRYADIACTVQTPTPHHLESPLGYGREQPQPSVQALHPVATVQYEENYPYIPPPAEPPHLACIDSMMSYADYVPYNAHMDALNYPPLVEADLCTASYDVYSQPLAPPPDFHAPAIPELAPPPKTRLALSIADALSVTNDYPSVRTDTQFAMSQLGLTSAHQNVNGAADMPLDWNLRFPAPSQPPRLTTADLLRPSITQVTPLPPAQPAPGSAELPSIGSAGHREGRCKPCAFLYTRGCENGFTCQFCHLCEVGEKKRRQKEKVERKRQTVSLLSDKKRLLNRMNN